MLLKCIRKFRISFDRRTVYVQNTEGKFYFLNGLIQLKVATLISD